MKESVLGKKRTRGGQVRFLKLVIKTAYTLGKNFKLVVTLVHRGRRLEREGCSDGVRSAQSRNGCGREAGTYSGLESKLHDTINLEDWVHGQKLGLKVRWDAHGVQLFTLAQAPQC